MRLRPAHVRQLLRMTFPIERFMPMNTLGDELPLSLLHQKDLVGSERGSATWCCDYLHKKTMLFLGIN